MTERDPEDNFEIWYINGETRKLYATLYDLEEVDQFMDYIKSSVKSEEVRHFYTLLVRR